MFPLRHENMRGRRWPIVTFALIGLNILAFVLTMGPIRYQQTFRAQARWDLLLWAASSPELHMSPNAAAFVEATKKNYPEQWEKFVDAHTLPPDSFPPGYYQRDEAATAKLQEQMDAICEKFEHQQKTFILDHYAFVPANPSWISYITANFLHGGWIHLLGNMWFLWLAGFILEDTWGRVIYSIFYLVAGAAALQFYAWCAPGSYLPLVGASGAVAALMGAFLVRFPKLKIEMLFWALVFRFRFKAPAYALLPLWLAMEFFYGAVAGTASPVAHWAHVGGFVFGMLGAYIIKRSGLEEKANEAIESKVAWSADPDIVRATDALDNGRLDEAASILENHLKLKPNSFDALDLLQKIHWRRSDMPAYQQVTIQLCQAHLKAQNPDAAWQDYEAYTAAGGDRLPPAIWLEIARMLETQQNFDRAASEYERLAAAHPTEKQSILALVAAGRVYLKRLNRPAEALASYEKAAASKVPHLDWQPNIDAGLRDSKSAAAQLGVPSVKA